MKVAVVILNYNSSEDCKKCASFLKQQKFVTLELIFVDNASKDGYIVKEFCNKEGYTFIQSKENKGYNAGNNIGLKYSIDNGFDYSLIINPDVEMHDTNVIYNLCKVLDDNLDIAVVGPRVISVGNIDQNPMIELKLWEEFFWPISIVRNKILNKKYVGNPNLNDYCQKLSGCCLLISNSFLKINGLFDENVFLFSEESILSSHILNNGYKLYYLAKCSVFHNHNYTKNNKNKYKSLFLAIKSREYYLRTYTHHWFLFIKLTIISKHIHFILKKLFRL